MIRWALALSLLIAPPAAQSQPLTLEEARAMTVPQLAKRVLGMSGDLIREVRIDSGEHIGRPGVLSQIYLARAPTRARFPGLCEAYVFTVNFEPSGAKRPNGQTPAAVTQIWRADWYRVAGDLEWPAMLDVSTLDCDDAVCAASGPVLWQMVPGRKPGFFSGEFRTRYELLPEEAWFGARALKAAANWGGRYDCSVRDRKPDEWLCADPQRVLAARPLRELSSIKLSMCADQPQTLCIENQFSLDPEGRRHVIVKIATATVLADSRDPVVIRQVTLEGLSDDD